MRKNPFFCFEPTELPLQAGNILISTPLSSDSYFERAVVLLLECSERGFFGIVLNRSLPITLEDIFPKEKPQHKHVPVSNGGPVGTENLFSLHTYGDLIKGSSLIVEGLYFGGFASKLQLSKNDFLDEHLIRFYLGYAGWSEGQLEAELDDNLWVIGKYNENLLFHNDDDNCWKTAVKSLGEQYHSWLDIAKEPFFN